MHVLIRIILTAVVAVAGVRIASAEPPAGVTVSPSRILLSSPEFSTTVTIKNDGDQPLALKLSAESWTHDDNGRAVMAPTTDLVITPATVTVPPHDSVRITVQTPWRPSALERAYRLFVDDGKAPAAATAPAPAPAGTAAAPAAPAAPQRVGTPVFVRYGRPIGVTVIESFTAHDGEVTVVARNVGGAHTVVQSVRVRGVGANGRDVLDRTLDGGVLAPQRRQVYRVPMDGDVCTQARQLIVTVTTNDGAPMGIFNMTPMSCPAKAGK